MTLREEVVRRLVADFGFREDAGYLRAGRCPACGRKSLWTQVDQPWRAFCNHENSCGQTLDARAQLPDLFADFERFHPATAADPHATARAFLASRGFDRERIDEWREAGAWKQDAWTDQRGPFAGKTLTTVCFEWSEAGTTWKNHRIVSPPPDCQKTRTWPAYKGRVWAPPGFGAAGDVYVVEGVMEALSLIQAGLQAVTPLSAKHVADAWLDLIAAKGSQPGDSPVKLKIAFNNDDAGRTGSDKWADACAARAIACDVLLPPLGQDWNDLLLAGKLAPDALSRTLGESRWRGRLHQAETAAEYYKVWREQQGGSLFEFRRATYLGDIKDEEPVVRRIVDCTLRVMNTRRVDLDEETAEYTDLVEVHGRHGPTRRVLLDADAWSAPTRFRAALKRGANGAYEGSASDLIVLQRHLRAKIVQEVRYLTVIGYDRLTDAYFFPGAAFDREGRRQPIDPDGSLRFAGEHYSLPSLSNDERRRWLSSTAKVDILAVLRDLRDSRPGGANLCVLGYYVACLFRAQVLDKLGFFPFLFLWGEHNAGKTPLILLCNRLLGRNDEGMPASPANTRAGEIRLLSSYSNLPVVITEIDEVPEYTSLMNLRSLYNGGPLRHTGRRTADHRTVRDDFLGGLVFTGNAEPWTDVPQRTRFLAVRVNRQTETEPIASAIRRLQTREPETLAGFLTQALTKRRELLAALLERHGDFTRALSADGIINDRVAGNYAVAAAGFAALVASFCDDPDERAELEEANYKALLSQATRRLYEVHAAPDNVLHFFDRVGQAIRDGAIVDYSRDPKVIAFSMVELENHLRKAHGLPLTVNFDEIKRTPHFIASSVNKARHPPENDKTVKCWVFRAQAIE